ncbi:hypothetical protein ACTQZS_14830 [Bilifractor sp. LCP19S3_H10]|uniref:hypothetical protein n=1 Tax=Bilifractor sp. LCP19S3_H10 TaxID=3438736 RepID=UPI003F921412
MVMIKGQNIILYEKKQIGTDPLGSPAYEETAVEIHDVLIAPVSSEEAIQDTNLYGVSTVYWLSLPKGDVHEWRHKRVSFFNADWQTVGEPIQYIEENVPLRWNKKIKVAHYE